MSNLAARRRQREFPSAIPNSVSGRRRISPQQRRRLCFEQFEVRHALAAPTLTSSLPNSITMSAGTALQIPLDGFDVDGDALTYQVEVTDSAIAGVSTSFRSGDALRIQYEQTGGAALSGTMVFKLFDDLAPRTASHIKQLVDSGFYDDALFHGVVDNYAIQGGNHIEVDGSTLGVLDDEFHSDLMFTQTGLLGMDKTTDDTNDTRFFITEGAQRQLDFQYTLFGMLVEGENCAGATEQRGGRTVRRANRPGANDQRASAAGFPERGDDPESARRCKG